MKKKNKGKLPQEDIIYCYEPPRRKNRLFALLERGLGRIGMKQYIAVSAAALLFVTAIISGVLFYNHMDNKRQLARQEELAQRNAEAARAASTLSFKDLLVVEDMEVPEEEEKEEDQLTYLSLNLTSLEKDLKIQVVDQENNLVKDVEWRAAVKGEKAKEEIYLDEDKDGVFHIKDIEPGSYGVTLLPDETLTGYVWPEGGTDVAVKGKIEYKVIAEIKNEIKKEAEVNVAAEDTSHNNVIEVEAAPAPVKDTVEFVESTKTEVDTAVKEEYVEYKGVVNVPKATASRKGSLGNAAGEDFGLACITGFPAIQGTFLAAQTISGPDVPKDPPKTPEPETKKYTVTFLDHDKKVLNTQQVEANKGAAAPEAPAREGYTFEKWDRDFSKITADTTVTAVYRKKEETEIIDKHGKLTDEKGKPLYKKVNDQYIEATGEDWANDLRTYYQRVEASEATYKYTGWQTIDGKTYYYQADGTYVTGEQTIGGVKYNFASDGSLSKNSGTMGIDVSKWNGNINWNAVKSSGVSYAIIRCGYRGSSTGALIEDPKFKANIAGAKAAGIKVGIYFFTQAITEAEAVEEASMCIALCKGYGIDYPVFMDVESGPRANFLDAGTRTNVIRAFCETIKAGGYTPGVYANKTWLNSYMHTSQLGGYKIWLAQYNASGPTYKGRYDLWQYTSKGAIGGINGYVDLNQSYLGY